jgi:hypothetical protein
MSADEEKPLLNKFKTKERNAVEDMEDIGSSGNANFAPAVQLSVRGAVMMFLLAAIVWVPAIRGPFPNQVQARIPLVICLFVFTINPLLGTAIQNACCGILGTFWACLHMWVMNGIFPGGMKEGMSPTSATAIFGWANFLIFTFLVLWCKCGIGTKMFALATDIGFMLAFLDPKSTMVFSENFTISHRGTAVNVLLATFLGCAAAPLMNLLPYPMSTATSIMKNHAVKASADTGKLFEKIIAYYSGKEASVIVESQVKHAADLRAELDAMGAAIGSAWWEGFDLGTRGTVRALMGAHQELMNNVYDRLRAILTVVRSEDFGDSHAKVMGKIENASMRVALATKTLLNSVTEAAGDGDISQQEKDQLASLVSEAKEAVKQLAKDFDDARKALNTPVSQDLLGENYFVLTISAYARLVIDYSEMMMTNAPQGAGFGAALASGLQSTWDMGAMTERFNMNFTIVHYMALIFCWFYSVYVDNWGGGCVITAVFLMSPAVCPDIQAFLNVLNAVILAVVAGTLVFQWTCGSGFGDYVLPFAALVLWTIGLYGVFAKSVFLLPCLVFVALTPFRWVTSCPTGDISAGARALWGGMVANILAILFVCGFQFFLGVDRANNLATEELDKAFDGLRNAFKAFWKHKDATVPMAGVAGACGTGSGFCGSAKIEPRFWRNGWKAGLYMDIVAHVETIRLDILMLWFAMAGSDGKPDGIFAKFDKATEFKSVQDDLNGTLEDAHSLAIAMLKHETGHFTGLNALKTTTGIDDLGALPGLIAHLNKSLKFETKAPESMEDDEICQVSTVCMLLDATIKHIAVLIKGAIKQA